MFQLSVVDHIRLSFGSVATSYRAHSRAAASLAARAVLARIVPVSLTGLATAFCLLALTGRRGFQMAAAALSALAFFSQAISASLDLEPRAHAHRACASRLWLLCEKYRSLLAEVHDGLLDLRQVTERRDTLMREVQSVYEHALPGDRDTYQIAREALGTIGDSPASDAEIDQLLPSSMRRKSAASTPA